MLLRGFCSSFVATNGTAASLRRKVTIYAYDTRRIDAFLMQYVYVHVHRIRVSDWFVREQFVNNRRIHRA